MKSELQKSNQLRAPEPARTVEQRNPACGGLGQTLITAKARAVLHPQQALAAIYTHAQNAELVSEHANLCGPKLRISTTADHSSTTVALASEDQLSDAGLLEAWIAGTVCQSCG